MQRVRRNAEGGAGGDGSAEEEGDAAEAAVAAGEDGIWCNAACIYKVEYMMV